GSAAICRFAIAGRLGRGHKAEPPTGVGRAKNTLRSLADRFTQSGRNDWCARRRSPVRRDGHKAAKVTTLPGPLAREIACATWDRGSDHSLAGSAEATAPHLGATLQFGAPI